MAHMVLEDDKKSGSKSFILLIALSIKTGMDPDSVRRRIEAMVL